MLKVIKILKQLILSILNSGHHSMFAGGKAGVASRRLLDHPIQPPGAPPGGPWPKQLQEFGVAQSVRHPPRSHHLHDAGRLLIGLLLLIHCPLPWLPYGRVSNFLSVVMAIV